MIRELLDAHGLKKCVVKAVVFSPCHNPSSEMIQRMPQRDIAKEATMYHYQEYKVACPNIEYEVVMKFIRGKDYKRVGFHLKDIDITMDYVGSFDKYELIEYLTREKGFRQEGDGKDADRVIVDNDSKVGRNCSTFMETIGRYTTRQKIYNKMVQMLECMSVQNSVGCHWKDWVRRNGTRLAIAIDRT